MEWLIVISGVWLIISPFVLNFGGIARANGILLGLVVAALALIDMARENRREMQVMADEPEEIKK